MKKRMPDGRKTQDLVFLESEGNNYFRRNRTVFTDPDKFSDDMPLRLLGRHGDVRPRKVLEIGCANGFRLATIHERFGAECTGVDPSIEAIDCGKQLYPNVNLIRALASEIPLSDPFDLVIVFFVLHWVGRERLMQAVSEIDRLTADAGYLLIGDFFPSTPRMRKYHHLPHEEVFTFKQDYASIFVASGLYSSIETLVYPYGGTSPDRAVCNLLRKSLNGNYSREPD